jgi:flavin reductase (DIM6/NTAB) family NADH-FMN oxidoreductase RutF
MTANTGRDPVPGTTNLGTGEVRSVPWSIRRQAAAGGESSTPVAVDRTEFVAAMSRAANGVSVVTTDGAAGRWGLTVSAVASVSADPAFILVCVNRRSPLLNPLIQNEIFGVSMLSTQHRRVADTFAGQVTDGTAFDFACADWQTVHTGAPLLYGAVAAFDCVLHESHHVGTHTICIGRVIAVRDHQAIPLLYSARQYGQPQQLST